MLQRVQVEFGAVHVWWTSQKSISQLRHSSQNAASNMCERVMHSVSVLAGNLRIQQTSPCTPRNFPSWCWQCILQHSWCLWVYMIMLKQDWKEQTHFGGTCACAKVSRSGLRSSVADSCNQWAVSDHRQPCQRQSHVFSWMIFRPCPQHYISRGSACYIYVAEKLYGPLRCAVYFCRQHDKLLQRTWVLKSGNSSLDRQPWWAESIWGCLLSPTFAFVVMSANPAARHARMHGKFCVGLKWVHSCCVGCQQVCVLRRCQSFRTTLCPVSSTWSSTAG